MPKSKRKKIFLALRLIAVACVGAFLGSNIYMWNARSLTGNVLPMPFGVGVAVVLSGSMEPELSVDDVILVVEQDSYSVGDVVVYQNHGAMVVHRIIKIDGNMVTTQGDANNVADDELQVTLIKGKVAGSLSNFGGLVRFVKEPVVSIVLLAAAVFLLERSYRKEKEQGDADLDKIKAEIRALKAEQEQ